MQANDTFCCMFHFMLVRLSCVLFDTGIFSSCIHVFCACTRRRRTGSGNRRWTTWVLWLNSTTWHRSSSCCMKTTIRSVCREPHNCAAEVSHLHSVSRGTAVICEDFLCLHICVVDRSPPQRSVSMLSFTSVQESRGVRMRRTYLLASASVRPPQRWVRVALRVFVFFRVIKCLCHSYDSPRLCTLFSLQL